MWPLRPRDTRDARASARARGRLIRRAVKTGAPRRGRSMKGAKEVIAELNRVLTNELTSVNQYFLHARMYDDWGFVKLGKKTYDESIGEMKHADIILKRILLLEGLPNLQDLHKLSIGENVPEGLAADLELERGGRKTLLKAIGTCEDSHDYVSRDLLRHILDETEGHIDWLETQLDLLETIGVQNYLQSQTN
jgi:bacterioferritin